MENKVRNFISCFDKRFATEDTIGVPENAKWRKQIVHGKPILMLRMSCGGGMGGSTWYEYLLPPSDNMIECLNSLCGENQKVIVQPLFRLLPSQELNKTGVKKMINTRYVVSAEIVYLYTNELVYPTGVTTTYIFLSTCPKVNFSNETQSFGAFEDSMRDGR